jgi:hypothetical protein
MRTMLVAKSAPSTIHALLDLLLVARREAFEEKLYFFITFFAYRRGCGKSAAKE